MNMKMRQISVLAKIHILLPFYLILTRGSKITVKRYLRVIFELKDAFLRWFLGACSIVKKIMAIPIMNPLSWLCHYYTKSSHLVIQ